MQYSSATQRGFSVLYPRDVFNGTELKERGLEMKVCMMFIAIDFMQNSVLGSVYNNI